MIRTALIALIAASPAVAQDWNTRSGDVPLDAQALRDDIAGHVLTYYDGGRSVFAADGSYSYTYFEGGTAPGAYALKEDATICIAYRNGFDRCDRYVRNGDRLVMQTAKGERFPVKSRDRLE